MRWRLGWNLSNLQKHEWRTGWQILFSIITRPCSLPFRCCGGTESLLTHRFKRRLFGIFGEIHIFSSKVKWKRRYVFDDIWLYPSYLYYQKLFINNHLIYTRFLLLGCGRNITGELDGILHSPNFPEKYASSAQENITQQCHWFIHVKPGHKVLLYFEEFEVEGKPEGKFNLLGLA